MAGNSWIHEYAKWIMQSFRDQVIEISSGLPCSQVSRQKVKEKSTEKAQSGSQLHTSNLHRECRVHTHVNCQSRGANTVITKVQFQSYEWGQSWHRKKYSELSCLDFSLIFISFSAPFFSICMKTKEELEEDGWATPCSEGNRIRRRSCWLLLITRLNFRFKAFLN